MDLIDFLQDRIDCLESHISKLVAQNNRLRDVLFTARNEIDKRNHCDDKLKDLCDFITDEVEREQLDLLSLNEIKAQAVSEVCKHFDSKFRPDEKLTVQWICETLNNHIGYLRQAVKGGE